MGFARSPSRSPATVARRPGVFEPGRAASISAISRARSSTVFAPSSRARRPRSESAVAASSSPRARARRARARSSARGRPASSRIASSSSDRARSARRASSKSFARRSAQAARADRPGPSAGSSRFRSRSTRSTSAGSISRPFTSTNRPRSSRRRNPRTRATGSRGAWSGRRPGGIRKTTSVRLSRSSSSVCAPRPLPGPRLEVADPVVDDHLAADELRVGQRRRLDGEDVVGRGGEHEGEQGDDHRGGLLGRLVGREDRLADGGPGDEPAAVGLEADQPLAGPGVDPVDPERGQSSAEGQDVADLGPGPLDEPEAVEVEPGAAAGRRGRAGVDAEVEVVPRAGDGRVGDGRDGRLDHDRPALVDGVEVAGPVVGRGCTPRPFRGCRGAARPNGRPGAPPRPRPGGSRPRPRPGRPGPGRRGRPRRAGSWQRCNPPRRAWRAPQSGRSRRAGDTR